jgi:hypothetical protein
LLKKRVFVLGSVSAACLFAFFSRVLFFIESRKRQSLSFSANI